MSDGQPSLHLEGTVSPDGGAWLWGAANSVSAAYGGTELGAALGLTGNGLGVDWTVGVEHYAYPGASFNDFTDATFSLAAKLDRLTVSAGVDYAPPQAHYAEDDTYTWVGADYVAWGDVRLHAKFGQDDGALAPTPYARDIAVGMAVPVRRVEVDLSYVDADAVSSAVVFSIAYHSDRP